MLGTVIRAMKAQRTFWCVRWEELLRAHPYRSPLANPDILVFKIPETCDEVFEQLQMFPVLLPVRKHRQGIEFACSCGLTPMLDYYQLGKEAMREAILRALRTVPDLSMAQSRDSRGAMEQVMDKLQAREIALLCSMCQLRSVEQAASKCHLVASTRER